MLHCNKTAFWWACWLVCIQAGNKLLSLVQFFLVLMNQRKCIEKFNRKSALVRLRRSRRINNLRMPFIAIGIDRCSGFSHSRSFSGAIPCFQVGETSTLSPPNRRQVRFCQPSTPVVKTAGVFLFCFVCLQTT
ncbi:MAG: hypothetical protein RLZZ352_468 [Pseudomonadota bacterium]|jgi:hypothetical protein